MKDQPDARPAGPAGSDIANTSEAPADAANGSPDRKESTAIGPVAAARTAGKALLMADRPQAPAKPATEAAAPPAPKPDAPAEAAGTAAAAPPSPPAASPPAASPQTAASPPPAVAPKLVAPPKTLAAVPPKPAAVLPAATPALSAAAAAPATGPAVTPLPSPRTVDPVLPPPPAAIPLPGAGTGAGLAAFSGASAARMRRRHWGLISTFFLFVILPAAAVAWYLWTVALDQYSSRFGFSVQKEEMGSAIEMLGGIAQLTGSNSTSDTDILYKFLRSRELVRNINDRFDLVKIWTRPADPVFSMPDKPTIEDIEKHWRRKVDIFYDNASHLIEVRVLAFDPQDALHVAEGISAECTRILNELSAIARSDATKYAREELDKSLIRLKNARQALTAFRVRSQIVDPSADVQGRMGLLNTLLAQQATALIDLDLLASNTSPTDPRYTQAQKRVEVIEERIRAERARFGDQPAEEDQRYADLVSEFEALSVDLEFAQQAYLSALGTFDSAVSEAQRKSRYLATYQEPTLAEKSEFPERRLIFGLALGFFFAFWSIMVLVYYTLRDRK